MEKETQSSICKSSPCNHCKNNLPHRSCSTVIEGKVIGGCTRWYRWAVEGWRSIQGQARYTIRCRDAKRAAELAKQQQEAKDASKSAV
jgi:hypothetical protein